MNIYDEAIETLENSKACTGFNCDYPNVIKALERAKKVEEELEEYKISDKSKEDSSILYYNLYKEAKRKLKKVEELLDLYRLQQEFKERYNTSVRLLDQQEYLDNIREIAEEIYLKEKELEEMK